jgi:hypothetical protein
MNAPAAPYPLPAPLQAALQRHRQAARAAAERSVESLGLAALSAASAQQRDHLLEAQYELNRRSSMFALAFDEAMDERVLRESMPRAAAGVASGPGRWDALSLVEDHEIELQVAAERFGMEIAHACEWELRELGSYMATLLPEVRGDPGHHPLRPEIVGHAMLRAIDTVSQQLEVRKLLRAELARSLAGAMRAVYADIVAELRAAGVHPQGLNVRGAADAPRREPIRPPADAAVTAPDAGPDTSAPRLTSAPGAWPAPPGAPRRGGGTSMGEVGAHLMSLIRRLAHFDPAPPGADTGPGGDGSRPAPLPPNLIHAHRDELRQASAGAIDHMVIDVVGGLFDAILADPNVPPQMARQIARLQLPVLRAALGDPAFFSSRRHPVRVFVNRIASLGAAVDDFADADGQRFLGLVRELVQEIVASDFEHIELYQQKLGVLENFVAEQARREMLAHGDPAAVLAGKEDVLRLQRHCAGRLQRELHALAAPNFVHDFLTEVWSRVLMTAARENGADSAGVQRLRAAACELFMSVQPKGSPAQRKDFVARLPALMRTLHEGLDRIAWPESARKAFFGLLLPAHADSLKGQGLRTLDYNLLARQVEDAFDTPLPTLADLPPAADGAAVGSVEGVEYAELPDFSAEEAARVGLVEEAAVDWNGHIDIDLGAAPELRAEDLHIDGLPAPDAVAPSRGAALAGHLQLGCAYQMHLEDGWQKVRLSHISAARGFFVFTHGKHHKQAISMTRRMLVKLCESGRLRAFENAYLLERATARTRRQLGALGAARPA